MTAVQGSILGNAVLRREDPSLLKGEDKYFDDMVVDGMAYVHFVRSTVAHATINSIDISDAVTMPGVIGVYTADNLELEPFLSFPLFPPVFARPLLAKGKVRLVGDIVAVVVAETRSQAVDAAESVYFDFDILPAVVDPEAASRRRLRRCCSKNTVPTSASRPASVSKRNRLPAPTTSPRSGSSASASPASRSRTTASSRCPATMAR